MAGRLGASTWVVITLALSASQSAGTVARASSLKQAGPEKLVVPAAPAPINRNGDEVPQPGDDDRDRERIRRMQETIGGILHNRTLGKLRVGLRVVSARTGRLYYGRRADALMDPASNQKVLATTAALMRLGADWRFRTEISGPHPDGDGVIEGSLHLRGNGDPLLRMADLQDLAARLRDRGVVRIDGGVVADPRRFGDEGPVSAGSQNDGKGPLVIDRGVTIVRVRPGVGIGAPAVVLTDPPQSLDEDPSRQGFMIRNRAVTGDGSTRTRINARVDYAEGRLRVEVMGRINIGAGGLVFRRRVPHPALHAAVLLRAALIEAGIAVRDAASIGAGGQAAFVEVHRSPPMEIVLRKINKDSDNEKAERVLQTVGAEVAGGAATTEKGLTVLREVIGGLGLQPGSYVARNGSGLGHANLITPHAMSDLLRALYLDPRVGPEMLQSLSVGGIDGTTRNRFKGTLAARRVRAKTGTLNSKSCLSGLVGDGDDVMAFSIMVQGFRYRSLPAVRASQVGAVNAMMRYVREGVGERIDLPVGFDEKPLGADYEVGGEVQESGEEGEEEAPETMSPAGDTQKPARSNAPADTSPRPIQTSSPALKFGPGSTLGRGLMR